MVKPLKPSEVQVAKNESIPQEVIEAVNKMIVKKWNGRCARFTQDELLVTIQLDREAIFQNKLLDFEPLYREAGWKVEFDQPGFNESYDASFTFTKP